MPDLAELDTLFAKVAAEYQQVQADQAELQRKLLDAQLDLLGAERTPGFGTTQSAGAPQEAPSSAADQPLTTAAVSAAVAPHIWGNDAGPHNNNDATAQHPESSVGTLDAPDGCVFPSSMGPSSPDMVTHTASPRVVLPSPALSLATSPLPMGTTAAASPDSLLHAMGEAMARAQAARATLGADVLSIATPGSSVGFAAMSVVDAASPASGEPGGSASRVQHISPELQRAMKANFSVSLMSWKLTETMQRNQALQQEVCMSTAVLNAVFYAVSNKLCWGGLMLFMTRSCCVRHRYPHIYISPQLFT